MKIALLGDIALIGKYDTAVSGQEKVFSRLAWLKSVLGNFDYVVGNLESPLTDVKTTHEAKSMPLRSDIVNVSVLKYLGIDAVSLANNHVYDFGNKGLEDVLSTLDNHGIGWFGIGDQPLKVERNGEKIAFQGFCCFTANGWHYDELPGNGRLHSLTVRAIGSFAEQAKTDGCYPVIIPHWGEENTHYPKSEHVLIARHVLDNFKCSIVGHHPHVPQGMIRTDTGSCAFSLGNLLFDDCYSEKNKVRVIQTEDNKHGYILVLDIQNGNLSDYELIPYCDSETGIVPDSDGRRAITEYSNAIDTLYGKPEYEQLRLTEQVKAREQRLGKRDFKWLRNHMNYSSAMSVVQRRINQRQFSEVVDGVGGAVDEAFGKAQIYYVGNFGMPHTNAPGKRVYANSLLFAKIGFDVLMIGTDPSIKGTVQSINDSISYISFPSFGKSTGRQYFNWLKSRIEKSGQKPKIIVRYGSPGLAIFDQYLYAYCHRKEIPVVIDVVDWLSVDSGNPVFKIIKGTDTFLEKGVFNKRGNGLIAISSYLFNYYGGNYQNKIIIPPLVEEYTSQKQCNETPQIVYAGNPFRKGEQVKNVHTIKDRLDIAINSFIALEQRGVKFDFHVVGMSKEEYLVAFPDLNETLNTIEHIHFHGRQPMEKTQEMISTMDFSILLRERTRGTMAGFPTKVVESLSLGVPVITTDTSDLRKYIQDGVNGFIVDINEQRTLEEQLIKIINADQETVENMKSQIVTEKAFMVDRYEYQFRSFIEKLLL